MNICFISDPWESINYENDSTTVIVHEAVSRGHHVGMLKPGSLTILKSVVHGGVGMFDFEGKIPTEPAEFARSSKLKEELLPMAGFDVIFLRADPPINDTMLNFLDSIKNDSFIVNDVDGLRKANNKLYPASMYDPNSKMVPITHVSKNKEYLKRVIEESDSDKMILKPLNSFGGRGVIVLEKNARMNMNSLLDFYIHGQKTSNYVIVQEFVEGAEEGDTRVIMLNGEPIGCVKRVPAVDEFRSNVAVGGSSVKHSLTDDELKVCKAIGPKLKTDGLYLAGLDLIRGRIIEINVVSPGGIHVINRLDGVCLQRKIIDFVEEVANQKHKALNHKLKMRKLVQNA